MDLFVPLSRVDLWRHEFAENDEPSSVGCAGTPTIYAQSEIPAAFMANRYDVLHAPTGVDFARLTYIRSRFSTGLFPVTAIQMGMSYAHDLLPCWISLLTSPICPCDAVICSTEASRLAMQKRLTDIAERYSSAWGRPSPPLPRLELIPWGIDTQRFAPHDRTLARRDLELPIHRPILLCVGRFRIQDKMDWTPLLLAFQHVLRGMKERPLLICAGSGPPDYSHFLMAQAAQMGIADHLRILLNFPAACLPSLYAACDIFVSPVDSPQESFGLTIVEAMACGRPVVASDWNGYKELIVHGETGLRVRTIWANCLGDINISAPFLPQDHEHLHLGQSVCVDVPQLARYLSELLQNREVREEMGRRGRARVEALYDWPVVIARWMDTWGELSRIAQSLGTQGPDGLAYLEPHYFEHFYHYATELVHESTTVGITPRGRDALDGNVQLLLHPWARGFIVPDHLRACLEALRPVGRTGAGLAIGQLLGIMHKRRALNRDQALMQIMWLAKYDLVSLSPDDSQAPVRE